MADKVMRKRKGQFMQVARAHGVCYDSLRRRLNGDIQHNTITGRVQGLQPGEEQALSDFAMEMSEAGLGLTKRMVKDAAMFVVNDRPNNFGVRMGLQTSGSALSWEGTRIFP